MITIAFTGGGTGGHIYPGLAIAEELAGLIPAGECRVFWIGSAKGKDKTFVQAAGLQFFGIPAGKLRRYFSLKTIPDLFRVIAGFFASRRVLKREKPALLSSKGGFVSVPPCMAAASLGIPVFTHESDFSPGLATKINSRFATRIFCSYKETASFFPPKRRERVVFAGQPVRRAFRKADPALGRAFLGLEGKRILLVLGGSQGALEINRLIRDCLPELCRLYTVVHQTGPGYENENAGTETYSPYPFIWEEMPHVLAAAELVIGRSGAGTVWECALLGKPMILIPLSGSGTRGDQVENARFFEKAGAAISLYRDAANSENLLAAVSSLAENEGRRKAMSEASRDIGRTDGAGNIAHAIRDFLTESA
jgi:UDP-N-acetylglucosamine--N-acetylmuramyl-(pentapeptide) pyrophosphoryl-undecaprenol N-acetylglucosamine transferase